MSEARPGLECGLYRHYKGGLYVALGVGSLSEDRDRHLVVYYSLRHRRLWLRPHGMFVGRVDAGTGEASSGARSVPRFARVRLADVPVLIWSILRSSLR